MVKTTKALENNELFIWPNSTVLNRFKTRGFIFLDVYYKFTKGKSSKVINPF